MNEGSTARFRIGELARRSGVSESTLRSWERRYGLLEPERTDGNYRLYSAADEERVRRTLAHIEAGLSTAEAAKATVAGPAPGGDSRELQRLRSELIEAAERLDERAATGALDHLFATTTIEDALREVVLPVLREVGDRWEVGRLGIGEEHFISNLLQARINQLSIERSAASVPGEGPAAVLACVPGERHSIGLACLALMLRESSWRVLFLGPDTPARSVELAARGAGARLVVLSAATSDRLAALAPPLDLPEESLLGIGGAGASAGEAERLGGRYLDEDPVSAAERLSAELLEA